MSLRNRSFPRSEGGSRRRRARLGAPRHADAADADHRRDKPVSDADMEKQFSELGVELRTARETLADFESFSSATIAVLDKRIRQLVAELEKTLKELADLEESRGRQVGLGAPRHADPADTALRCDRPVADADMEKQFSELGVELRTSREKLAHYESFSSATIAVLDGRIRQLVAELEKTLKESADLKEDSEKRMAALEEENSILRRATALTTEEARNESPGNISIFERRTREIGTGTGGGPEIEERSASPLDFLFRKQEPSLQEIPANGQPQSEQPHPEEARGGAEARPTDERIPAGAASAVAEAPDRGAQGSQPPVDVIKGTTDEFADITDNRERRLAALEHENAYLQRVIAERRIPALEEENIRLHQAIALATGDSRDEGQGHRGDLTDNHSAQPQTYQAHGGQGMRPVAGQENAGKAFVTREPRDSGAQGGPAAGDEIKKGIDAAPSLISKPNDSGQEPAIEAHPSARSVLPPVPEAKPLPSASFENRATEPTESVFEQGEIQLIISPFSSFGAINRFTSALRSIPGVSSATIRRFQKGRLQVAVEYAGVVPLGHRLGDLREFRVRVIESSQERLEALIESSEESGQGAASRVSRR